MAILQIDVPDAYVPDLAAALAEENGEPNPTTGAQRQAVAIRWLKREWKERILNYRANRDADASRASNPARDW